MKSQTICDTEDHISKDGLESWAAERAGVGMQALSWRFLKLPDWERGAARP